MNSTKKQSKLINLINMIYPPIMLIAFLLIFWEVMCLTKDIPVWMLAKPTDIGAVFLENTKEILPHIWTTYSNILIGFALSVIIGITLAVFISSSEILSSSLTPLIIAMCCVPMITLVPMLMLALGTGNNVKIITIVIQSFPLVNMNAAAAFINVDPTKLELMTSLKANRYQQFKHCIFKASLPGIFTGVKLASIMSMLAGVTAEMTGGNAGLGSRISYFIGFSKTSEALSCLVYIIVLGTILYGGITLLENKLLKNN